MKKTNIERFTTSDNAIMTKQEKLAYSRSKPIVTVEKPRAEKRRPPEDLHNGQPHGTFRGQQRHRERHTPKVQGGTSGLGLHQDRRGCQIRHREDEGEQPASGRVPQLCLLTCLRTVRIRDDAVVRGGEKIDGGFRKNMNSSHSRHSEKQLQMQSSIEHTTFHPIRRSRCTLTKS